MEKTKSTLNQEPEKAKKELKDNEKKTEKSRQPRGSEERQEREPKRRHEESTPRVRSPSTKKGDDKQFVMERFIMSTNHKMHKLQNSKNGFVPLNDEENTQL